MGVWLDKFEQFILNYARRFISILLIVSITAVIISLVFSAIKYFDYASSSVEDNFEIPKFNEPQKPISEEIKDNKKKKKKVKKKQRMIKIILKKRILFQPTKKKLRR